LISLRWTNSRVEWRFVPDSTRQAYSVLSELYSWISDSRVAVGKRRERNDGRKESRRRRQREVVGRLEPSQ